VLCLVYVHNGNYESVVNVSQAVSGKVTLPCTISGEGSISWLYIHLDTAQQIKVYGNNRAANNYEAKFSAAADPATGNYSLILFNAQINDSGWYVCISESGRTVVSQHIINLLVSGE
jgi:Immunoglobulin V-set domain